MEDVVNPWKGRRVLVTGHTGFKGSWLCMWLARRGARIRGFALDPFKGPSLFAGAAVFSVVEDMRGDIRDASKIGSAMADFSPEVVFHLAAQPLVRSSYADPIGTYATNVMGTAHVLEAVRKTSSVRAVVCVTTDKCYENREWVWPYRETDPLGGYDPYSSSKACAEIVCAAYRSSYFPLDKLEQHGVAVASARAGNVIGGGDWSEDRLIPDLVRGFKAKQPVRIRQPQAIRPWQHVLEPLHGYVQLAEALLARSPEAASPFNFGPGEEDAWPVYRIADRVAQIWGEEATWISDADPEVHEARSLRLDTSKARAKLGWRPLLHIETALEWTVSFYREWQAGTDLQQLVYSQIAAYEEILG